MPNTLTIFFVLLIISLFTGCSNKPREVTASIPLVSNVLEKPNKQEIPAKYWAELSDESTTNIIHDIYEVKLGITYISALGFLCRELTITDNENNTERRVACELSFVNKDNQIDKSWFLEKAIVESSSYVEL